MTRRVEGMPLPLYGLKTIDGNFLGRVARAMPRKEVDPQIQKKLRADQSRYMSGHRNLTKAARRQYGLEGVPGLDPPGPPVG